MLHNYYVDVYEMNVYYYYYYYYNRLLKRSTLLRQAFLGNQVTCLKILPSQIQTIVELAAQHQHKAPQYLDLLNAIVRVDSLGLTLKRNQAYVMKFVMQDYARLAYILDQPAEMREKVLVSRRATAGGDTLDHLRYYVCLVDLLATCAEVSRPTDERGVKHLGLGSMVVCSGVKESLY